MDKITRVGAGDIKPATDGRIMIGGSPIYCFAVFGYFPKNENKNYFGSIE